MNSFKVGSMNKEKRSVAKRKPLFYWKLFVSSKAN